VLRSLLADIIDLYEVNRKECARILFDFARWCRRGTFVGKGSNPEKGLFGDAEDDWVAGPDGEVRGGWVLDDVLVEVSPAARSHATIVAHRLHSASSRRRCSCLSRRSRRSTTRRCCVRS
jgi:hypothetical protein